MKHLAVILLSAVLFAAARACAASETVIWDDAPATGIHWYNSWYPLGNGRLGCTVNGAAPNLRVQFNVDSLWSGDENLSTSRADGANDATLHAMGFFENFGEMEVVVNALPKLARGEKPAGYRRELDLKTATYADWFEIGGARVVRKVFVSAPADAIFVVLETPENCEVLFTMHPAHGETAPKNATSGSFAGELANGLKYAARADVLPGGTFTDGGVRKKRTVIVLRAVTGTDKIGAPPAIDIEKASAAHVADYKRLYDRMELDLGDGDATIPTRERLARVRGGATDVPLIELMFNFGRYLLISSSRPGTLPANLQGIWNHSNRPAWNGDFHTNINLQMNYWGADSANLSECFTPLSDWMMKILPVVTAGTRAAFPESKGYAFRIQTNAVGGGCCGWNVAGAPWLAAQCYDHWLFTRDRKYLKEVCWPLMKGAAEFLLSTRIKERADGSVVLIDGWSPEHGPREDAVAHEQQIARELFRAILAAAKELEIDDPFVKRIADLEARLLKDKIGRFGQLQEWETDRDKEKEYHRHTSHLYAVYPGTTISRTATPELAAAAKVALDARLLTGDGRRSWTWPWRAALWARLGEGDKAGEMLEGLLRYNTLDNMFATHPPFQIDGNLGMVGAVCEMLLERSIPSNWKHGKVRGLKTREGKTVDFAW